MLLALMPAAVLAPSVLALAPADKWTPTVSPINLVHIDFCEINRHGVAVGYHHRPNGMEMEGAQPEHYTLEELQAALEIWIDAIERARRRYE